MKTAQGPRAVDGRQLRWEEHKAQRRQLIIDAALDVLRELAPGEEFHVQQVADRAGLNRTAIHRLFKDRTDLDLAVQREIAGRATEVFLAAVDLDATPRAIVHRIVDAFVRWAVDHLAWVNFVERGVAGVAVRPMDEAITRVVEQVEMVIAGVASVVGGDLSEDDRALLEPWVSSLIGGGLSAVQRWMAREELRPDLETFIDLITDISWAQIDVLAKQRGLPLESDSSVQQLVDRLLDS